MISELIEAHRLDSPETTPPNPQFMPHAAADKYHGTSGPIHTSFNDFYAPFEEDFVTAAYEVGGTGNTLVDAWSGDHLGFYSSLGAVNRTTDPGKRSYAATGYLRPNLGRKNLKVLTEAQATRIVLDGTRATGIEFVHKGVRHQVSAAHEVILSAGVIQSPQLLELSGIGDPDVLRAAGVECVVENNRVGANFQDHVLGGMLFDLADGVQSMDALQGAEYAKAQQELYEKTNKGPYGSPGMLMGFVSYASLVSKEQLDATIAEIRENSLAQTDFEKAQEQVWEKPSSKKEGQGALTYRLTARLSLTNYRTQRSQTSRPFASHASSTSVQARIRQSFSLPHRPRRTAVRCSSAWSTLCRVEAVRFPHFLSW